MVYGVLLGEFAEFVEIDVLNKIWCCFQIDLQTFLTLTDQDLKELGITTFGARRKMLLAISGTNKEEHVFITLCFSCQPSFLSLSVISCPKET